MLKGLGDSLLFSIKRVSTWIGELLNAGDKEEEEHGDPSFTWGLLMSLLSKHPILMSQSSSLHHGRYWIRCETSKYLYYFKCKAKLSQWGSLCTCLQWNTEMETLRIWQWQPWSACWFEGATVAVFAKMSLEDAHTYICELKHRDDCPP